MKKEIKFHPAWDKRSDDPKKNYGIHGVGMQFTLAGELGAITFTTYTNWHLPHVQDEVDARGLLPEPCRYMFHKPQPADISYHARTPRYEGQEGTEGCHALDGATCYSDGSGLAAEDVFRILLTDGSDGVWEEMERWYLRKFNELR